MSTLHSYTFPRTPYTSIWSAMQKALPRIRQTGQHEIWLGEHPATYTLGQAAKQHHLLTDTDIPTIRSDRGGQITYHGPGQLMFYTLLNLSTLEWGIRRLVTTLEQMLIEYCAAHSITANSQCAAPGVYIDGAKMASIGLRVRHGCCYHGMAINHHMDLSPFDAINPCGYQGLRMTQLYDHGSRSSQQQLGLDLCDILARKMDTQLITTHQSLQLE